MFLGRLYLKTREPDRARSFFEKARDLDPEGETGREAEEALRQLRGENKQKEEAGEKEEHFYETIFREIDLIPAPTPL